MSCGHDDGVTAFVEAQAVTVHADAVGNGRMGIEEVAEIVVDVVDDGFRFFISDPAAFKVLTEGLEFFRRDPHGSCF